MVSRRSFVLLVAERQQTLGQKTSFFKKENRRKATEDRLTE